MQALDNYINEIKTLPPAPRVLSQLLVLLNEEEAHAGQIVELIAFDPALTAKVLQRCNNAAAGLGGSVSDLDEAVTQVGFNTIYRLVAMVIGEGLLGSEQPGYGIGTGGLWEHSVRTAVAARVMASKLGGEENLAFTAALLHDIGKLVLGRVSGGFRAIGAQADRAVGPFLPRSREGGSWCGARGNRRTGAGGMEFPGESGQRRPASSQPGPSPAA